MDDVRRAAVGKELGAGEGLFVGRGDEQGPGDVLERLLAVRHHHGAGVPRGAQRVREPADVVQAVGREVAVVNKEDIQGEGLRRKGLKD